MAANIPEFYTDVLYALHTKGEVQDSRNGKVRSIPQPVMFTVWNPRERVLFDSNRRANPFFHLMETVWMFAGRGSSGSLKLFNSNIESYADGGWINGAYGHRWRYSFGRDQILDVVRLLTKDPNSRQAVINMWDPVKDNPDRELRDRPCNTQLMFRMYNGQLNMTVINRSNDAIWGMTGANAVHMTYLQELVAGMLDVSVGAYTVFSNNLHIYEHHWPLLAAKETPDLYDLREVCPYPLKVRPEEYPSFVRECGHVLDDYTYDPLHPWLREVVVPMRNIYLQRKGVAVGKRSTTVDVVASDWRRAAELWEEWYAN